MATVPQKTDFALGGSNDLGIFNKYYEPGKNWGNVWYVNSANTNATTAALGGGRTPATPLATLQAAHDACTNNNDDRIEVAPTHTESLASAGAITFSKTGIHVIGRGRGNLRPTFTWHTTDASWLVSGANNTFENLRTTVDVDEIVSMFAVSAAGVTFDKVDFVDGTAAQAIQFLLTTAAADQLTIVNCTHIQTAAAGSAQKWIQLVGTNDTIIRNNTFLLTAFAATTSHLISGSTATVNTIIDNNLCYFLGATITIVINMVTTSTGFITRNLLASGTSVATAAAITGDAMYCEQNYWLDDPAASGILTPGAGTD